jgi:hypothetical protein
LYHSLSGVYKWSVTADLADLLLAKRLVATGQARAVRESAGNPPPSRADLARGQPFTVGAVRLWEKGARNPRGAKGAAYGRVLRQLLENT